MQDDRRADVGDEWLSVADVAAELDVHPATVRNWASDGTLRAQRAGKRKWRFSRQAVEEFIRANSGDASAGVASARYTELDPGAFNPREDVLL